LEVPKNTIKFTFPEDNTDMSISESLVITNHGNAAAKFKWLFKEGGVFTPTPIEEEVPAGGSRTAKITFVPQGPKTDDELLTMQVEDGNNITMKCSGIVAEARCRFVEKAHPLRPLHPH